MQEEERYQKQEVKRLSFGVVEQLNQNFKSNVINNIIEKEGTRQYISTNQKVLLVDGKEIISTYNQRTCASIYIKELKALILVTPKRSKFIVYFEDFINKPVLDDVELQQLGVIHMAFDYSTMILFTFGMGIKSWKLSCLPASKRRNISHMYCNITEISSFGATYNAGMLQPPVIDSKRRLIYLYTLQGMAIYDFWGKLQPQPRFLLEDLDTVINDPVCLYTVSPYNRKIVTSEEKKGTTIWNQYGQNPQRMVFTNSVLFSVCFLSTEFFICFDSGLFFYLVDIKTLQFFPLMQLQQRPSRVLYLSHDSLHCKIAVITDSKLQILVVNIPYHLFKYRSVPTIKLERCPMEGKAARIASLLSDSSIFFYSPKTGCPVTFCHSKLIAACKDIIVDRSSKNNKDQVFALFDNGDIETYGTGTNPSQSIYKFSLNASSLSLSNHFLFIGTNGGDVLIYDHNSLEFRKRFRITSSPITKLLSFEDFIIIFYVHQMFVVKISIEMCSKAESTKTWFYKICNEFRQDFSKLSAATIGFGTIITGFENGVVEHRKFPSLELMQERSGIQNPGKITDITIGSCYYVVSSVDGTVNVWDFSGNAICYIKLPFHIYSNCILNGTRTILVGSDCGIFIVDGNLIFGNKKDPENEILDNYDKKTDVLCHMVSTIAEPEKEPDYEPLLNEEISPEMEETDESNDLEKLQMKLEKQLIQEQLMKEKRKRIAKQMLKLTKLVSDKLPSIPEIKITGDQQSDNEYEEEEENNQETYKKEPISEQSHELLDEKSNEKDESQQITDNPEKGDEKTVDDNEKSIPTKDENEEKTENQLENHPENQSDKENEKKDSINEGKESLSVIKKDEKKEEVVISNVNQKDEKINEPSKDSELNSASVKPSESKNSIDSFFVPKDPHYSPPKLKAPRKSKYQIYTSSPKISPQSSLLEAKLAELQATLSESPHISQTFINLGNDLNLESSPSHLANVKIEDRKKSKKKNSKSKSKSKSKNKLENITSNGQVLSQNTDVKIDDSENNNFPTSNSENLNVMDGILDTNIDDSTLHLYMENSSEEVRKSNQIHSKSKKNALKSHINISQNTDSQYKEFNEQIKSPIKTEIRRKRNNNINQQKSNNKTQSKSPNKVSLKQSFYNEISEPNEQNKTSQILDSNQAAQSRTDLINEIEEIASHYSSQIFENPSQTNEQGHIMIHEPNKPKQIPESYYKSPRLTSQMNLTPTINTEDSQNKVFDDSQGKKIIKKCNDYENYTENSVKEIIYKIENLESNAIDSSQKADLEKVSSNTSQRVASTRSTTNSIPTEPNNETMNKSTSLSNKIQAPIKSENNQIPSSRKKKIKEKCLIPDDDINASKNPKPLLYDLEQLAKFRQVKDFEGYECYEKINDSKGNHFVLANAKHMEPDENLPENMAKIYATEKDLPYDIFNEILPRPPLVPPLEISHHISDDIQFLVDIQSEDQNMIQSDRSERIEERIRIIPSARTVSKKIVDELIEKEKRNKSARSVYPSQVKKPMLKRALIVNPTPKQNYNHLVAIFNRIH